MSVLTESYIKLAVAALLPVVAAVILFYLNKKTKFGNASRMAKQIVYGVVFGVLAIVGTEWGIPMNGAQVNCRDAAVLTAGLMFGGPAGIIAGVIGGVERWIAVAWGVGTFTRVACTVSTILAGFFAAALRKFMFEDKKPGWLMTFAVGIVVEVFHLTMVFITNMATPAEAMAVVGACAVPMVVANGLSVMVAAILLTVLSSAKKVKKGEQRTKISQTIQKWLLITVLFAFVATSYFVFELQDKMAIAQEEKLLTLALDETEADIRDASNHNLLDLAHIVANEMRTGAGLEEIASAYGIAEINAVDEKGIIVNSTAPEFIGYDMATGDQSAEFLCLLGGAQEYVQDYGPISYDISISRKYAGVKTDAGFVQVGYDAAQFQKDIDSDIVGITKNRHVGQTGYILIIDERYNVVSAPKDVAFNSLENEIERTELPGVDITFTAVLNDEQCCFRYRSAEGYHIVAVMPEAEVLQTRNIALCVNAFMEILVFAVMFGLIYMLIKRVVVNQIEEITGSLAKIANGDLNEVVNVRSNEEFASLSDDINMTVDTLKHYIDEAAARIDKELEFAKSIQLSALPNIFPAFPTRKDFDIYASTDPAKEVGGDFYDFYMTGPDTMNFLIADVSGKGIPAAMFMMRAKTELKSRTETQMPLSEVFTTGNNALCEGNEAGMFVTAWQGKIDFTNGAVQFANAGHNPPLLKRANGQFEYLKSRAGLVLAGMEGVPYKMQELQMEPGDIIYLYTDGVTEATNANTELYGEERLRDALNSREFESMQDLCRFVKAEVDAFVGDAPQFDDITMVALRYIGTPPAPFIHFDEASLDDITAVTEFVESELEKLDCSMKVITQINVAIDEIYSNIVNHGYEGKRGPATVTLIVKEDPKRVYVRFADQGIPYNPLTRKDPDTTLSADERTIGGLGIYIVKKTMDDIKYKYEDGQNILTIKKIIG